jgi:hypothetical protein
VNDDDPIPVPTPAPAVPWWKDTAKILLIIAALTGLVNTAGSVIGNIIASWNHDKLTAVENKTDVQAEKTDQAAAAAVETKQAVAEKSAKTERTLDKLASANLPNLYASLLYLESVAKDPDRPTAERDKARVKAQETRRAIAEAEKGGS